MVVLMTWKERGRPMRQEDLRGQEKNRVSFVDAMVNFRFYWREMRVQLRLPGRSYAKSKQKQEEEDTWYFENLKRQQEQLLAEQEQYVVPLETDRGPRSQPAPSLVSILARTCIPGQTD